MKEQTRFIYALETEHYDYSAWCKANDSGIFYRDIFTEKEMVRVESDVWWGD